MAGRKKTFPCGHFGKGQYCHRCAAEESARKQARDDKQAWAARIEAAPISLGAIPKPIAERALKAMSDLDAGKSYLEFRGKRLASMGQREVITIPIGQRYRLICLEQEGALRYLEVLSHEQYNNRLASGGWA